MIKLAPSILSADFANMGEAIILAEKMGADYIHCDVMDGCFVPNITFGAPMIRDIRKKTGIPLDVHLMIDRPERYIEDFAKAGAGLITVHAESTVHLQRTLQQIKNCGVKPGVVLNPATPLSVLDYIYDDVDMILLMSVNPGFGGQSFIPAVMAKIKDLRHKIDALGKNIDIEVDGGVSVHNALELNRAGATVLVAGNAVYGAPDPIAAGKEIKDACADCR